MDERDKRLTLRAAIVGSVIVFLDGTVVNVALPSVRGDLGGGLAGQQWVTDAYLLTLGALLLLGGSLGDLYGRRRVFRIGLLAFGATSVACAFAPSIELLVAGRAAQGLAGALLVPNTLGLIVARFSEHERGHAIGRWTAWSGIAMVIGPLTAGLLLAAGSWRLLFAINVAPILYAHMLAGRLSGGHDRAPGGRVDWRGGMLGALGLGGTVYALIEGSARGWGSSAILVPLLGGLATLAAFGVYELRAREPMIELSLFRRRNFVVGNAATLAVYGGLGAAPLYLVVFLQQVAGYSPLGAGAALLPVTVIMFAGSGRIGAMADRYGPRAFMAAGPLVAGAGIAALGSIGVRAPYASGVLPAIVVFGLGLALTVAPLTATVLGDVPQRHAGIASAVNNAVARIGGLLAVAAIGAVLGAQFSARVDDGARAPGLSAVARAQLAAARERALVVPAAPGAQAAAATPQATAVRRTLQTASTDAFALAMLVTAALVAAGGLLSAGGIRNPRQPRATAPCPGPVTCAGAPALAIGSAEEYLRESPMTTGV